MGIECSLILSEATFENATTGHAYCLITENGKYKICDPNFYGINNAGKSVPFIFTFDANNTNNKVTFNPNELGAIAGNCSSIEYDFPWSKFKTVTNVLRSKSITITSNDIATADKEKALSTSDIEEKKRFVNRLLDKFRGKGEK